MEDKRRWARDVKSRRHTVNAEVVTVGSTGTIASLMSKEIDSMRKSDQNQKTKQTRSKKKEKDGHSSSSSGRLGGLKVPSRSSVGESWSASSTPRLSSAFRNSVSFNSVESQTELSREEFRKHLLGRRQNGETEECKHNSAGSSPNANPNTRAVGSRSFVQIVDVKCTDSPFTSRLKRLSFSRLYDSVG